MAYDEKLAARVRRRLADVPGFSEKRMFGGLCFLLDGHMCCGINGRDLMLRVRPEGYEAALARPGARPMDFTGRPLRGMVYVSADALRSARTLTRWLDESVAFVRSLPPKRSRDARRRRRAAARH